MGQIGLIQEVAHSFDAFFLRRDLRAVKSCWSESLSVEEAAEWLGVASEIVLSLSKEKALKVERNPEQTERVGVFFNRNAVARLLERVNFRTINFDFLEGMIPLAEAAQQLACVHLSEARLLKRVLSRSLRAWRTASQQDDWGIGEISFTQKDIDDVLNEIALSRSWLSADDVSDNMGVDPDVFLNWVERGLIKPVIVYNKKPYLKACEIEKFSAKYIFDHEARKLLDISWQRLLGYIRRGKLKPVAGPNLDESTSYLLLRKKVERLARHQKKRKSSVFLNICETQSQYI